MSEDPFIVGYFDPHDKSIGTVPVHLDLASMLVAMEESGLEVLSVQDGQTQLLDARAELTRIQTLEDIVWGETA